MTAPLLTIGIPTFNRAFDLDNLLASCVRELAKVPPGSVRILVSDNCSPDDTPAIVEKHKRNCDFIDYVRNAENIGMQMNFWQCITLCRSEYLWLIGDDEVLTDNGIKTVLENIQASRLPVYIFNYLHEGEPHQAPYLQQVYGRPVDTNVCNAMDFMNRHGWLWTMGNLGMVVFRAEDARKVDISVHQQHFFMQASLYLEAFHDQPLQFVNQAVFMTTIRAQTVNKERWEKDGSADTWPRVMDSLKDAVAKGILKPRMPLRFFNGCSHPNFPMWNYATDRIIGRLAKGALNIPDFEWEFPRQLIDMLDDEDVRGKLLYALDNLKQSSVLTQSALSNMIRAANTTRWTLMGEANLLPR